MPTIAVLAARPAHRRYTLHTDKNIPSDMARVTAAAATAEIRAHLAARAGTSRVTATPHGSVFLNADDHRVLFEPLPDVVPKRLTARQAADLLLISHAGGRARFADDRDGITVHAGMTRIPPAATERLVERGWIEETDGLVGVSLAGAVALEWRYHKTAGTPVAYWTDQIGEALADLFAPEFSGS